MAGLLDTYTHVFSIIEAAGHPLPKGVLVDKNSFDRLVDEGNAKARIPLIFPGRVGQVELLGVVFRSAKE